MVSHSTGVGGDRAGRDAHAHRCEGSRRGFDAGPQDVAERGQDEALNAAPGGADARGLVCVEWTVDVDGELAELGEE